MPGGTGRCTETATVRGYSGNGGAKRGSGGTRPRLDAQAASEAITWVEEAQNIAVEEGHLKRVKPALPEATRRGDAAGGEERGAEPHLYISRDEAWHGTVACACVGATRAHAATYPRMQQRRGSLHVFNKPQATPHSVQAGTMHVAAITSAADELPSPRRGAPDRTERTQPFIVHLRFVQMQRAHRQPCGRCVSQHAAQLVRSVMHTLLYCQGRELPRPPNILRMDTAA